MGAVEPTTAKFKSMTVAAVPWNQFDIFSLWALICVCLQSVSFRWCKAGGVKTACILLRYRQSLSSACPRRCVLAKRGGFYRWQRWLTLLSVFSQPWSEVVTPRKGAVRTAKGRNFLQTAQVHLWELGCQQVTRASSVMKTKSMIHEVCRRWTSMPPSCFMACESGSSSSFWNEINLLMQCQI